jgi:drug/metabolite transporter (DMT)-like permease
MILWLCVLVRIAANPFSNVIQKLLTRRGADSLFIIFAVHGLLSLACAPVILFCLQPLPAEFWVFMSIGALFTVSGNVLIVAAVKRSDLSVLGPINAYKAIVSLVPGFILLHEIPGPTGLCGIALIVAGSYFIVDNDANTPGDNVFLRFFKDRGVQYRFAALVLSAIEAVVIKRALLVSSPLATFAFWSLFGFGVSFAAAIALTGRRRLGNEFELLRQNKATYLMLFATTGLMQFCTIVVLEGFQVGYALALFQTSTIVSVVLGWHVFRERHFVKRLAGSVIMAAGAVLIILGNR